MTRVPQPERWHEKEIYHMDNSASSPESSMSTEQAVDAFTNLFGGAAAEPPKPEAEAKSDDDRAAELLAQEGNDEQQEVEPEAQAEEPRFKVKIDGKEVEVAASELTQGYQRQQDYTKKTMEAAEARKAAEAEIQAARTEREQYSQRLEGITQHLQAELQGQQNIDWQQLLDTDPVEFLRQQHLAQQRQATLQQLQTEQQRIEQQKQAEQAKTREENARNQHQALLDKLPEWKNPEKAKADLAQLSNYLAELGYQDKEDNMPQHLQVLCAHKARLYDAVMAKAKTVTQRINTPPLKVERPGVTNAGNPDKRTSVVQQLKKSGGSDAAATAAFAAFL
jgi:hypothetical protein